MIGRMKICNCLKASIITKLSIFNVSSIYNKEEGKTKLISPKRRSFFFFFEQYIKKCAVFRNVLLSFVVYILLKNLRINVRKSEGISFFLMTYGEANNGYNSSSDNLYDILELPREASLAEVKKAYRNLSLKKHPDKIRGKEEKIIAQIHFQKINFAYTVLSDPKNKKYYDIYGDDYEAMKEYFDDVIYAYNIPELYAFKKHITIIYRKNCEKVLLHSPFTWIINFYHPNCHSCKLNTPTIIHLAERVSKDNKFRVGVVNCAVSMHFCQTFDIPSVGIIYFFFPNQEPGDFWNYTVYTESIIDVDRILKSASNISFNEIVKIKNESFIKKQLLKPVDSSFLKGLIESVWLLEYYKVGCAPCKQLKDELNSLAKTFRKTFKISVMNCDKQVCDVPYYPYLKLFVKRKGISRVETLPFIYTTDSHPAALAISVLGFLLEKVLGFEWKEKVKEDISEKNLDNNKIEKYHYEEDL